MRMDVMNRSAETPSSGWGPTECMVKPFHIGLGCFECPVEERRCLPASSGSLVLLQARKGLDCPLAEQKLPHDGDDVPPL